MKKIILCFGISILLFGILVSVKSVFSIQKITIDGVGSLRGIDAYSGRFLPFMQEEQLEAEIRKANPILAEVKVYKQYPNTVYITAHQLRSVLVVMLTDGYVYVSEAGTILAKNRSEDQSQLPTLTYYQPLFFNQMSIGESVEHAEIVTASYMVDQILDLGIAVTKIDITNENMIVLHTDTFTILVTSMKDAQQQLRMLDYTYTQLRREGKEFSSIDVRFEKPIIKL